MKSSESTALEEEIKVEDAHLLHFQSTLKARRSAVTKQLHAIIAQETSLHEFSKGTELFGLRRTSVGWCIREYLPGACEVHLIGDFNDWNRGRDAMSEESFGRWSASFPADYLKHGHKYKLAIKTRSGEVIERVPAWADHVVQNPATNLFDAVVWHPSGGVYQMKHCRPKRPISPTIYEAHIGISSAEHRVSTFDEFRMNVLPRIKRLGYNTIQIMAVMEHAYYGSFGYHVTSFFAPSSRFGTPDELRRLVDEAHGMGITVLMDIVHSHMSNNYLDGIAALDGTDHCYTLSGPAGRHDLWDSALFDYSKWEVLRFLLSNCRYYIEDFGFDGFRFDGITSMLYKHHGIGVGFSGDYNEYFGDNSAVDIDALVYLSLANKLIHELIPNAMTVAEDVSGMPLLCRPVEEGGVGFDYRLAMAIPDMWIKLLKEQKDEDWNMGNIVHTLTNRRWNEGTISYAESHDQAIVGDKTIAMWLMDAAMYTGMDYSSHSLVVERGIALHKMIRLISMGLGNNGYLNFIGTSFLSFIIYFLLGNEWGSPEWLDPPREGNNWSYHYFRRQWNLVDCGYLRYSDLERFDAAMIGLQNTYRFLDATDEYVFLKDEGRKIISWERGGLVFIFNFHPSDPLVDHPIPTRLRTTLRVILDSDQKEFGGHGERISHSSDMYVDSGFVKVYIPPRCCAVLTTKGG